jgi:large conductance mechanosensitive channel
LKQGESTLPAGATLEMAREVGAVTFNYGQFLTDFISFLLLGLGVFLIFKGLRSLDQKEEAPEEPTEKDCPYCQKMIPIKASRCPFCTSQLLD